MYISGGWSSREAWKINVTPVGMEGEDSGELLPVWVLTCFTLVSVRRFLLGLWRGSGIRCFMIGE